MEPASLILAALNASAAICTEHTAMVATRDSYAELKALLASRLSGRPVGETALEQYPIKPDQWAQTLEAELVESGAAQDASIVDAALQVMKRVDLAGFHAGKYRVFPG